MIFGWGHTIYQTNAQMRTQKFTRQRHKMGTHILPDEHTKWGRTILPDEHTKWGRTILPDEHTEWGRTVCQTNTQYFGTFGALYIDAQVVNRAVTGQN